MESWNFGAKGPKPFGTGARGTTGFLLLVVLLSAVAWTPQALAQRHAYAVPLVPSAANPIQQGFVRILNQSDQSGDVRITPIDDAGLVYPEISIHLEPWAAVHFNSDDLEYGNPNKGIMRGVGAGSGDWRLEVEADYLFEALAYIRTHDGFVTSVFEAAGWWDADVYWLPFFNPGSNHSQVSKLRLVNTKNETARVVVAGIDDRGSFAPGGRVELSLPPRASRTITSAELETGAVGLAGQLGDGEGKWRLWIVADRRLHVLGLLESPTGNLTNLSTGSWWHGRSAPMVLPSTDPRRQGFLRVVNNSAEAGHVEIRAIDDDGRAYGPVTLSIGAMAATHFNSQDLANGNPRKGLAEGIGAFDRDLRLQFESDLVITPLAYVRTADGFVTSVHDLALSNNVDTSWLPLVNPGSNRNQESLLRLINRTDSDNAVEIWGRDDDGRWAAGGSVALSLPPGGARTITAAELEGGADGLTGGFGDGHGKWTLFVSSDEPVEAMSLLNSPTGNLTNLSETPYTQRLRITNAPVAHDVSLTVDLSSPYIDVQLMADDPDGDPVVGFALDGGPDGDGYEEAYVEWETGRLSAGLHPGTAKSVWIPYRATDGYEWSDRAYVVVSIEETDGERGLGAHDVDAAEYARLARAYFASDVRSDFEDGSQALPRSIDLSGNFPVPGNQGTQSSCVGWAVAYLKSYQERMEERWDFSVGTQFSPAWVYNQINRGQDAGSRPLDAMELLQSRGAATLATMPYDPDDYWTQPSAGAVEEAANYLGGEVRTINTVLVYKQALAHRVPFVLAMPVYDSFNSLSGSSSVYNDLSGPDTGGHAVVVVGYDDDRFGGAFRVLNSWGTSWGDGGFFWIPYEVFRDWRFSVAALTIQDLENGQHAPVDQGPSSPGCGAIGEDLPNLTVASWEADYSTQQGGSGQLRWHVVNRGTASAAAGVDLSLMLSEDATINGADHWVTYEEIPFEIEPGGGAYRDQDNELHFTFPETIPPGTYYMAVWVDDIDEVAECDESDNVSIGDDTVVLVSTKPDLAASSWYAEWDGDGNGTLEYQVDNVGAVATTETGWRLALLLHTAPDVAQSDRYDLFTEPVEYILEPGGYVYRDADNPAHFGLQVTTSGERVPPGIYYMTLWVDDLGQIDEANEINNQSFSNGVVTVARASASVAFRDERRTGVTAGTNTTNKWRERFNGRVPPIALTRRVEIEEDENGNRQVRFVDKTAPGEGGAEWSAIGGRQTGPRPGNRPADDAAVMSRVQSADVVTGPVAASRPMP